MEKSALLQKVLALKQNGYTNKQIIEGLSNEGISMTDIQEVIIQAELKRIVEEQNTKTSQLQQSPLPQSQLSQSQFPSLPPLPQSTSFSYPAPLQANSSQAANTQILETPTNNESQQSFQQSSSFSSQGFGSLPSQQVKRITLDNKFSQLPSSQTDLPPAFLDSETAMEGAQNNQIGITDKQLYESVAKAKGEIIAEIKSELERIVEIIVAEKVKQYAGIADKISGSQTEISAKIKTIEETNKHLSSAIERQDMELTEQTKTLSEQIQKLTAELIAMNDFSEKLLPVFIDNVKKLTIITDRLSDMHKDKESATSKSKKPEKEE